jgi:plasmid maintenance system antidote protein VapI
MLMTKRKPATVGEILIEEFMRPMGLWQVTLAQTMMCSGAAIMGRPCMHRASMNASSGRAR